MRREEETPETPTRSIDVAIAIVTRNDLALVCQRRTGDRFGGCWEFPGGKVEPDETLEQCLGRELWEELEIRARPVAALTPIEHDYPNGRIRLHPYVCVHVEGEPKHIACQESRWVSPQELRSYTFPPANERLIDEVIQYFGAERSATPSSG